MERDEYVEYFDDTIFRRTPKSDQKGCYAKVSSPEGAIEYSPGCQPGELDHLLR